MYFKPPKGGVGSLGGMALSRRTFEFPANLNMFPVSARGALATLGALRWERSCEFTGVTDKPDLTGCLANYLEREMGCRVPSMLGSSSSSEEWPVCADASQTEIFLRLSNEMQEMNQVLLDV